MAVYAAFLRGVNVSGKNILKMVDLKIALENAGYSAVSTYIQSGNIRFEGPEITVQLLERDLSLLIYENFKLKVPVIVKAAQQMEWIVTQNPYPTETEKLYVTLLDAEPEHTNTEQLRVYLSPNEKFTLLENVIYTIYGEGAGKTKFTNTQIEKKLKLTATTRNWNTILKMKEMTAEIED